MPARNLELKCRYADLPSAIRAAEALGARREWTKRQTDTYFNVPRGRLKLREQDDRPAELIAYERPDAIDVRASDYHLVSIPEPARLIDALAGVIGIRVVVAKQRTLYLFHNVRIHFDVVEQLGTFIEFEAVLSPGDDEETSRVRLDQLTRALGIQSSDTIGGSYSDLLERQRLQGS